MHQCTGICWCCAGVQTVEKVGHAGLSQAHCSAPPYATTWRRCVSFITELLYEEFVLASLLNQHHDSCSDETYSMLLALSLIIHFPLTRWDLHNGLGYTGEGLVVLWSVDDRNVQTDLLLSIYVTWKPAGCSGSGHAVHLKVTHKNRNSLKAFFPPH